MYCLVVTDDYSRFTWVFFLATKDETSGTQSNGFTSTKASDNAVQARKEKEHVKDYILLPLWTADLPFFQDPKSSHDDGSKPLSYDRKKGDEDLRKENECNDQKRKIILTTLTMLILIFNFSNNDEDDGPVADMNNLDITIQEEPKKLIHALKDPSWIEAMQEELLQFNLQEFEV
nr:hypothetical protein [Tanacetum cinerariifolium]